MAGSTGCLAFSCGPSVVVPVSRTRSASATCPDGDSMVVVGSFGGADRHPAWYHNVVANPEVIVQNRERVFTATAETLTGAEREAVWGGADRRRSTLCPVPGAHRSRDTSGPAQLDAWFQGVGPEIRRFGV